MDDFRTAEFAIASELYGRLMFTHVVLTVQIKRTKEGGRGVRERESADTPVLRSQVGIFFLGQEFYVCSGQPFPGPRHTESIRN